MSLADGFGQFRVSLSEINTETAPSRNFIAFPTTTKRFWTVDSPQLKAACG